MSCTRRDFAFASTATLLGIGLAGCSTEPNVKIRTYTVTVNAQETLGDQVTGELVTHVVLASDGVLLIYDLLLAPIALPIMFMSQEKHTPVKESFR